MVGGMNAFGGAHEECYGFLSWIRPTQFLPGSRNQAMAAPSGRRGRPRTYAQYTKRPCGRTRPGTRAMLLTPCALAVFANARCGRVAQLVRALVSHTRGPGFESLRDHARWQRGPHRWCGPSFFSASLYVEQRGRALAYRRRFRCRLERGVGSPDLPRSAHDVLDCPAAEVPFESALERLSSIPP